MRKPIYRVLVIVFLLAIWPLLFFVGGLMCGLIHLPIIGAGDYQGEVEFHGAEALDHLMPMRGTLPESADDIWVYDGGNWNGVIYYLSFRCGSVEDCWAALETLGAPDESAFHDTVKTEYAVNWEGPRFYRGEDETEMPWEVASIRNGKSWEDADGDRRMSFYAVDLDTLRVYYHYESGGFPTDRPGERRSWRE